MNERAIGRRLGVSLRVQSKISARSFGASVEFTPEETGVIAQEAGLSPIADGQEWKPGLNLADGTIVKRSGKNYLVLQGHISQAGWEPEKVPALFKEQKEDYAAWKQPLGAHDAYMKGDKVSHKGNIWVSTADGNVWEPGVYGWQKV